MLSLATPAVFLAGSIATYGVAKKYGNDGRVSPFIRGCETLAWVAFTSFLFSKLPAGSNLLSAMNLDGNQIGIWSALAARTLAIVPMALDFIRAAQKRDAKTGFPPVKNQLFWLGATFASAAAISLPLTSAAIVPLGYVAQAIMLTTIALISKKIWQTKTRQSEPTPD